jgi:uncharacterized damage-inducible protein DinB
MPTVSESALGTFFDGWAKHQNLMVDTIEKLTPQQLGLRPAPNLWAIWQLAGHVAGARAYWFHDIIGEGDAALRDLFRVTSTTVPDLPIEDAGWEDDEDHPRGPAELADVLRRTWSLIESCLHRWTPEDLMVEVSRPGGTRVFTRSWVLWHLVEHDVHHGGEISLTLGSHGLGGFDL